MKKYSPLKPGDTLGVCAPSARFDKEKLDKGIHVLKNMGFEVEVPEDIYGKKRYLAGDDVLRAKTVNRLFSDPKIDGVICARGGFGSLRILDHLDWTLIKQHSKPFIGYSDITALLISIISETGNPVIHGPNVVSLAEASEQTLTSFYSTLGGTCEAIEVIDAKIIKPGKCSGVLKGGNLATLSHLLGTRFQPDFFDAVLFLEDIGEPAYKIDRMLTQMKLSGVFQGIRGVITGSFENCDNDEYIEEIVAEIFDEYEIPVLSGLSSGHGRINLSLTMGVNIEMDTTTSKLLWI